VGPVPSWESSFALGAMSAVVDYCIPTRFRRRLLRRSQAVRRAHQHSLGASGSGLSSSATMITEPGVSCHGQHVSGVFPVLQVQPEEAEL